MSHRLSDSPPLAISLPAQRLFETSSQGFASALIAAHLLEYRRARLHENGRDAIFVFYDPEGAGKQLLRECFAETFPKVHAAAIAQARKFLTTEKLALGKGAGDGQAS